MVGLVLMTMIVVGGYVHLQKHRRAGTTSSTGSTPAHGVSMSGGLDAPILMDMRPTMLPWRQLLRRKASLS